ncbi:hypothetical protein N1851_002300 [Merluccius polli]|uniref:Myb/SANT-like DNA-binding domain-containing protein n=1 Tax=Merluccius polli TaxID=89951 RepID=A0AA47PCC9_MERPO|nr:hypothetical protein N1851_002300 [Merluccius polli]
MSPMPSAGPAYGDFLHIFRKKSNTAAAAKQRETAWEKIASRVNACNPAGEKRTWQQLKMKYKNIVQTDFYSANRKKADARKTGGGPAPPPLTVAEELALSHNTGRPVAEGIPGGSSSSECTPQDTSAFIKCNGPIDIFFFRLLIQIFICLLCLFFRGLNRVRESRTTRRTASRVGQTRLLLVHESMQLSRSRTPSFFSFTN